VSHKLWRPQDWEEREDFSVVRRGGKKTGDEKIDVSPRVEGGR